MLAPALIALSCGGGLRADLAGTLTVGDRSEVRVRSYQGEAQTGVDAVTTPVIHLELVGERVSYSLSYLPTLTLADMELGLEPQIFQSLSSGMSWRATRELRFSLGEDASYGTQNYTYLSPTPSSSAVPGAPVSVAPAPLQLLPGAQTLLYGSSRTSASMQLQAARHLLITLSPSFFAGGGLDAASRTVLPLQKTPRVELGVTMTVDRRDTLATLVAGTDTGFTARPCDPATGDAPTSASLALAPNATCTPHNDLVELSETWRRRLTRADDLTLSAGVTGVHAHLDPGGDRQQVFPTGALNLVHRLRVGEGTRGELSLDVRLAPIIDVRLGTIDQRGQAVAAFKWKPDHATVTVGAGFTQSIPPSEADAVTFVAFNGEALYAPGTDKRFEIGGGYRGAWQEQQPFGPFFSNVFYAVFVYHEPALRLWP